MNRLCLLSRPAIMIVVAVSSALSLTGCASSLATLMRNELAANHKNTWDVQVQSATPPYRITSSSTLYGNKTEKAASAKRLQTLSQGQYRNWHWIVKAPPAVAISWRVWQQNARKTPEVAQSNSTIPPALDWTNGMKRLYAVTRYLLGEPPLPLNVNIRLIPHGKAYHSTVTVSAPNHVPLAVAFWYPTSTAATADAQEKRFHDFRKVLAVTGGLLQKAELAAGVGAAPAAGNARRIKKLANTFCWRFTTPPALAGGTAFKVLEKFSAVSEDTSSEAFKLAALTFKQYPRDSRVARAYANILLFHDIQQYLRQHALSLPTQGTDLREINALLGYCQVFLHYSKDIRNHPPSFKSIQPADFFPVPKTTSSQQ